MANRLLILFAFALSVMAAGCAPTHFHTHETSARIDMVKTIGIISPDIQVYQLSKDGGTRLDQASEAASRHSAESIMEFFKGSRFTVKVIGPDLKNRRELQEVQALSKAVHKNLQEFWNPVNNIPPPTLGSLDGLAEQYGVEAFMFMDAFEVHKEENVSLSKSLAKLAVGAVYGPYALPRQGRSRACVSVAMPGGAVIWASFRDSEISLSENFKDQQGTRKLVRGLLSKFPL